MMDPNLPTPPWRGVRGHAVAAEVFLGRLTSLAVAAALVLVAPLRSAAADALTIESGEAPAVLVELFTSEVAAAVPPLMPGSVG